MRECAYDGDIFWTEEFLAQVTEPQPAEAGGQLRVLQ